MLKCLETPRCAVLREYDDDNYKWKLWQDSELLMQCNTYHSASNTTVEWTTRRLLTALIAWHSITPGGCAIYWIVSYGVEPLTLCPTSPSIFGPYSTGALKILDLKILDLKLIIKIENKDGTCSKMSIDEHKILSKNLRYCITEFTLKRKRTPTTN